MKYLMIIYSMKNGHKWVNQSLNPDTAAQATEAPGVAQDLMERAEADAGRNPAEAAELRDAARAFLSVVR